MNPRYTDDHGTVLEFELFEGRIRIITDADRMPQGHPVWLTRKQLGDLVLELAGLWVDMKGEG